MTYGKILNRMKELKPVVHCIGNDISTAATANLLLAAGARPVMTYAPQETEEISCSSSATVLNCGTPTEEKFKGLLNAAKGTKNHPLVIDPVGVGASRWRKENIKKVFSAAQSDNIIIHCNYSEALALLEEQVTFEGVDSIVSGIAAKTQRSAKLAEKLSAVVIISGRQDVISDGKKTAVVYGGNRIMGLISGSGCMLGALAGAFSVAGEGFETAVTACAFWKKRAEKAYKKTKTPGSFMPALIDSVYEITSQDMEDIKVEYN